MVGTLNKEMRNIIPKVTGYLLISFHILFFTSIFALPRSVLADSFEEKPGFHKLSSYQNMLTLDQIETNLLYDINMHFIENEFTYYYRTGDKDNIEKIVKGRGYSIWNLLIDYHSINPFTGKSAYILARLLTSATHVTSDLWCIYQKEYNGNIYEYWMLQEFVRGRTYKFRYCEFIITNSSSLKEKRRILKRSQEFIKIYKVDDNFSVQFPDDRLSLIYSHGFIKCPECCSVLQN